MNKAFSVNEFKSSVFRILPGTMRGFFSTREKIALFFRAVKGVRIVYLVDAQNRLLSYCFLKKNYLFKYPFLNKQDWLINPYCTMPEYRGCGYASVVINYVTNMNADNAIYALVKDDNIPSIRTLEKCGFLKIGYSREGVWSHTISPSKGNIIVYKYINSNSNTQEKISGTILDDNI